MELVVGYPRFTRSAKDRNGIETKVLCRSIADGSGAFDVRRDIVDIVELFKSRVCEGSALFNFGFPLPVSFPDPGSGRREEIRLIVVRVAYCLDWKLL